MGVCVRRTSNWSVIGSIGEGRGKGGFTLYLRKGNLDARGNKVSISLAAARCLLDGLDGVNGV